MTVDSYLVKVFFQEGEQAAACVTIAIEPGEEVPINRVNILTTSTVVKQLTLCPET